MSYYPYHKDDLIGSMFEHPRRYFAARGYANLQVDFRGVGNSSGLARDAMDAREAADGAATVGPNRDWSGVATGPGNR